MSAVVHTGSSEARSACGVNVMVFAAPSPERYAALPTRSRRRVRISGHLDVSCRPPQWFRACYVSRPGAAISVAGATRCNAAAITGAAAPTCARRRGRRPARRSPSRRNAFPAPGPPHVRRGLVVRPLMPVSRPAAWSAVLWERPPGGLGVFGAGHDRQREFQHGRSASGASSVSPRPNGQAISRSGMA